MNQRNQYLISLLLQTLGTHTNWENTSHKVELENKLIKLINEELNGDDKPNSPTLRVLDSGE